MSAHQPPRFDHLAGPYAALEHLTFGGALMRRRLRFAGGLTGLQRVLVLGDGDGRFSAALASRAAGVTLTAVDASAAMLARLEARLRRCAPHTKVELRCVDARDFVPDPAGYDAVVAHFFFDCFTTEELTVLVRRIAAVLPEGAPWVVSEFAIPAGRPGLLARVLVRALYLAFRVLTGLRITRLPDHGRALSAASFACHTVDTSLGGLLRSELWIKG